MKKFLVFAFVVLFAEISSAGIGYGLLKDASFSSEGGFYGFSLDGNGGSYDGGNVFYGIFGISSPLPKYKDIVASFSIGYTNVWGDYSAYSISGAPISDEYNQGILQSIRIVEANAAFNRLFDADGLSLKIGRQFYGDYDSLVMYFGIRRDLPGVAANGNNGAITSIDAITAYYEGERVKINAVFGVAENNSLASHSNSNETIRGFDFKYFNIGEIIDIQAYFYDTENIYYKHYDIVGTKGTFHKEINDNNLKISMELARSFGGKKVLADDEDSVRANVIKLDGSFEITEIKLTPRASFGLLGGYNEDSRANEYFRTFGNYYPGLISESHASVSGFYDVQILNLGADYVYNKFIFSVDYFDFSPREGDWDSVTEIDLSVKYQYNEAVAFGVSLGHLFADDSEDDLAYAQFGVSWTF